MQTCLYKYVPTYCVCVTTSISNSRDSFPVKADSGFTLDLL